MPVLEIQNLKKSFTSGWGSRNVFIKNLSLRLEPGEVFALVGPNGSGKTTLTKLITSLLREDDGLIQIFDKERTNLEVKKQLGYLPEMPQLPPFLNARELLMLVCELYDLRSDQANAAVENTLQLVGLKGKAAIKIKYYSKGMLKRLGLAQVLVSDPSFLILDEPIDGLDPLGIRLFRTLIEKLKGEGKTVFFTSHLLSEVEKYADRVAFIKEGEIIFNKSINEISGEGNLEEIYLRIMNEHN